MSAPPPALPPRPSPGAAHNGWSVGAAVLLVLAFYALFPLANQAALWTREPLGHYQYLTDALLSGQTHLKLEPHPGLAALENPYAGAQGVPRLHDATYYQGKYYLYFGVTPVVLLSAPWTLLTGTFLTDTALAWSFTAAGFLVWSRFWLSVAARFFPGLSRVARAGGVVAIGLASYLPILVAAPMFYHVASAAGCFCLAAAFAALIRASRDGAHRSHTGWLAVSSLAWGLAVGARPNLLFTLPVLAAAVCALAWMGQRGRQRLTVLVLGFAPCALVGAALAAYNQVRFGSVAEFGITYQFTAGDNRYVQLVGLKYILPNAATYLLNGARYQPYYPWVEMRDGVFGVLPWAPFAVGLVALAGAAVFRRAPAVGWRPLALGLVSTAALGFLSLLVYAVPVERYALDFLVPATAGAVVGWAAAYHVAPRRLRPVLRVVAAALLVSSAAHAAALALALSPGTSRSAALARVADGLVHPLERLVGVEYGAVHGRIRFQPRPEGTVEPLLATGGGRDLLVVEHRAGRRVRFGFIHFGTQSPWSDEVNVTPGAEHGIEMDLGSLYPGIGHPAFQDVPSSLAGLLRRRVRVRLDGQTVYETSSVFYPAWPGSPVLGRSPLELGMERVFSGSLQVERRGGVPAAEGATGLTLETGVALSVQFPPFRGGVGEPLASVGPEGAGQLLYVTYLGEGRMRLGLDSARGGAVDSRPLPYQPGEAQTIVIALVPLEEEGRREWRVWHQGRLVLRAERTVPGTWLAQTLFGFNGVGSTAASPSFSGPLLRARETTAPDLVRPEPSRGTVRLTLSLPMGSVGAQEPLLVTGEAGKGDFVFVDYLDAHHVRIGYDHWGVGGFVSEPVLVDYRAVNQVEITTGALRPDEEAWAGRVQVRWNDQLVIDRAYPSHPTRLEQITAGRNPLGGSSCGPAFTGTLHAVEFGVTEDKRP